MELNPEILGKIRALKRQYTAEGFIVLGVFGSVARGDDNGDSDVDILYRLETDFINRHPGWKSCARIEQIQKECAAALGRDVDLADVDALDKVSRYFILPEVVYVA